MGHGHRVVSSEILSYAIETVCSTGGGGSGMDRIEAGVWSKIRSNSAWPGKTVIGVMGIVERDLKAGT